MFKGQSRKLMTHRLAEQSGRWLRSLPITYGWMTSALRGSRAISSSLLISGEREPEPEDVGTDERDVRRSREALWASRDTAVWLQGRADRRNFFAVQPVGGTASRGVLRLAQSSTICRLALFVGHG